MSSADPVSTTDLPAWVFLLSVAIPAMSALVGVIFQARKTRAKGTHEHLIARDLLLQHGEMMATHGHQLERIETKVDTIDGRVDSLEEITALFSTTPPPEETL